MQISIVRIEVAPEYKAQTVADTLVAELKTARVLGREVSDLIRSPR